MAVTVAEFAENRGASRQAVYTAIKRHSISTYQGVSNGKATQFMTDEEADRLNALLGPSDKNSLLVRQNLELQIHTERENLLKETSEKVEAILREKEAEISVTRTQMVGEVVELRDKVINNYENRIAVANERLQMQRERIKELEEENRKLKELLREAVNHPYQHIWKASHDASLEDFRYGKPAKSD